jgi:signal transduction histidine kinase
VYVDADADRLKQALLNLVLNGAQAQVHGGVVRLRGWADRIEVEDEGPGIPETVRERLFEPFVTTRAAGIGLGLAVVARVAEEHGFALDFQTGREGTVFVLSFASA